jgi:formylglycine-generating enzyme
MRLQRYFLWSVALLFGFRTPLEAQGALNQKRALIVSNTAYRNFGSSTLPLDDSGPRALKKALEEAQFDVEFEQDLTIERLIQVFNAFKMHTEPGGVYFVYYLGYVYRDEYDYFLPVDFNPNSTEKKIYSTAYAIPLLTQDIAGNNPKLSMFVFDANWSAAEMPGRAGVSQEPLPSHTWMFASASTDEVTTQTAEKMGLFTKAVVNALRKPGLELREIASQVINEVETTSNNTQRPLLWSTDAPEFYFHEKVPETGRHYQNKTDKLDYVYIPAGTFQMGCVPDSDPPCRPNESPRHLVEISKGFWLGQTEVTYDSYQEFAAANKMPKKKKPSNTIAGLQGDVPVVFVTWDEAQKYCNWAGGRLPTEAEWERAARDGKDDAVYPFSNSADTTRGNANAIQHYGNDKWDDIAPVRKFLPSLQYKLFDMAGNVWEWVSDWYSSTYYLGLAKESLARDPENSDPPDKDRRHVIRGGSWSSDAKLRLRISYREAGDNGKSGTNVIGFRCLLPDEPTVRKQLDYSE